MKLTQTFKHYCRKHHLFDKGDRIIVGISGGKDSVALAHLLKEVRSDFGLDIILAHFNHRLRRSADRDEAFVAKLAKKWGLPLFAGSSRNKLRDVKGSLEENAREERFTFLIRLARRLKADGIALAHTRDDLAETVLMRLIRGGGMQGLAPILPKRVIEDMHFIRPLLSSTTAEIRQYLRANRLQYCTDPTNKQTKFFRNKIRLELLPHLEKKYNKNIKSVLADLSENLALDYDFLKAEARKVLLAATVSKVGKNLTLNVKDVKRQHVALQKLMLRQAIETVKGNTRQLELVHVEELLDLICWRPRRFGRPFARRAQGAEVLQ